MPVFSKDLASRISSRFSPSVEVSSETFNGEEVVVFHSKKTLPELHDQILDYYGSLATIVDSYCEKDGTIVKFKLG